MQTVQQDFANRRVAISLAEVNAPEIEIWRIIDLYRKKHPKTSYDRQINPLFYDIGVAESNSDVTILTGSAEITISLYAQYIKFGQKH